MRESLYHKKLAVQREGMACSKSSVSLDFLHLVFAHSFIQHNSKY